MKRIKKNFLSGFLALLPALATIYVLVFIYKFISGIVRLVVPIQKIVSVYIMENKNLESISLVVTSVVTIISVLLLLVVVFLIGLSINTFVSNKTIDFFEGIILKIPLANSIYGSIKQVIDLLFSKSNESYKKTVLLEYPKKGMYSFALVTKENNIYLERLLKKGEMSNIYIATSPSPTSGFYMIVEKSQLKELDITVEETFKSIISGGTISPKSKKGE